jgi:hypothetical protein
LATLPLGATTVLPLDLVDLSSRAASIAAGIVLSAEPGSVQVGGATLPTVTYEILVEEGFKGTFVTKGDQSVLAITTIGDLKGDAAASGSVRKLTSIPGLPQLKVGSQYLLFTTAPSAIGLSTTVGLGTGCFEIHGDGDKALVVNELDNAGVFQGLPGLPVSGPVTYGVLAQELRNILGQ